MSTTALPAHQSVDAPRSPAGTNPGLAPLLVLLTGIFITTLDFFIVNVAIPSTQQDLHASSAAIQFVVVGYGLALAAGLITAGRLGDLYGRRRLFHIGMALFTLASAACGAAPSAGLLVGARIVQGAAAALLMPQVLGIINTVYTGPHRARAFNAFGLTIGIAAVFGQFIGGVLVNADVAGLGWRTIYLINVPIGLVALSVISRLVPEVQPDTKARLDLVGAALAAAGLVAVVFPLVQGQEHGWPAWTWFCLAASVPLLGAFVWYQRRVSVGGGSPLVNLRLFASRTFSVGVALGLAFQLAIASFFVILALYLQYGRGLSALDSGLVFAPVGAGYFVTSVLSGRLAVRIGRQALSVGAIVVAAGYALLAVTATESHGSVGWLIPGLVIAGAGMGFVVAPLPAVVMSRVDPTDAAAASGVLSTCQQAGNALGVALVGVVFYHALGNSPEPGDYPHAFALGLRLLVVVGLAVAAFVQLLPGRASRDA